MQPYPKYPAQGELRPVGVDLFVENGGIAIDWGMLGIPQSRWWGFIYELWGAAGFAQPKIVPHVRNADNGTRTDWNRLRVSAAGCRMQNVDPADALPRIREFLESEAVQDKYHIAFEVYILD